MPKLEDREQVALVGARLNQALEEECESIEAHYLRVVIPGLQETWQRFCQGIVGNLVTDGAELEEMVADGEFWPKGPTKESVYLRDVFAVALSRFEEWEELSKYLDFTPESLDDDD